jgi:hypothetical protein
LTKQQLTGRVFKLPLLVFDRDLLQRLNQFVLPPVQVVGKQVLQLVLLRFQPHALGESLLVLGLQSPDVIV